MLMHNTPEAHMRIAAIVLALALFLPTAAHAGSRGIAVFTKSDSGQVERNTLYSGYYALVIGVGAYHNGWPRLPKPVQDAREIAATLQARGFEVELLEDPDSYTLRRAFNKLVTGPGRDPGRGIVVWYSGHGYTLKEIDGTRLGYLVPIDAPLPEANELDFMEQALNMRQIVTVSRRMQAKHVMMIFDSCFSGSIFQLARAKPSPYIEAKIRKPVRLFITSGDENEQVPDKSLFKTLFSQGLEDRYADRNKDGYVTGMELGDYLQENVINYTRDRQHPQFGKINNPVLDKGDFVFVLDEDEAKTFYQANLAPRLAPKAVDVSSRKNVVAVMPLLIYGGAGPTDMDWKKALRTYPRAVVDFFGPDGEYEVLSSVKEITGQHPQYKAVDAGVLSRYDIWQDGAPYPRELRKLAYEIDADYILLCRYTQKGSFTSTVLSGAVDVHVYDVQADVLLTEKMSGSAAGDARTYVGLFDKVFRALH